MKKAILSISLLLFAIALGNPIRAQVAVSVKVGRPVYCPPKKVIVVKPAPVVVIRAKPIVVVPRRRVTVVQTTPRPVPPPLYATARPRRVVVVR